MQWQLGQRSDWQRVVERTSNPPRFHAAVHSNVNL